MSGESRPASCLLCATWGAVTASGLCHVCRDGRYRVRQGKLREATCRRCGWPGIVGADGTCRGCRIAVRLGEDDVWMHAELELDHTIYLDELTSRLASAWLAERYQRWPTSTNPYLLVTARTAVDDTHPMVCPNAIMKSLRRQSLQVTRLRVDRILDEAKHTADPLHLVRLFGISPITAMRYLRAAHPGGLRPDPAQA